MRTSEKFVVAHISVNGRTETHRFPISTANGELMTHRLKRLVAGGSIHCRDSDGHMMSSDIVEMVWRPPYVLFQEILRDRLWLQARLTGMAAGSPQDEQTNCLMRELPTPIPESADSSAISTLIARELRLRKQLKQKLQKIERSRETQGAETSRRLKTGEEADDNPMPRPYEDSFSGGWNIH